MSSHGHDGKLQVLAGVALLKSSRLVRWDSGTERFSAVPWIEFEAQWKAVDPVFGRLACWILFSAGAEMLAKGLCLLHNVMTPTQQDVPAIPTGNLATWAHNYVLDPRAQGTVKTPRFGQLGDLVKLFGSTAPGKTAQGNTGHLTALLARVNPSADQRDRLLAAYDLLRATIRNRDAHAYLPNERDSHHHLVGGLFVLCFNDLVSWLPAGSSIAVWINDLAQSSQT